jgi:hypothetical protein
MRPIETIPRMQGEGIKNNVGGDELQLDIWYIVRTSVNVTMYTHYNKIIIKTNFNMLIK